jgi:hypothetical protein
MNAGYIIQTIIEITIAAALVVGLIFEPYIAEAEQKLFNKWRVKK